MRVEEEAEARREFVNGEAALERPFHIFHAVAQRECQFLRGGGAGFANVIPGDRDGVVARHLAGGELDGVRH